VFAKLSLILAALSVFSLARADELDNIQRDREMAQMRYANEIGTGKYKTPAQQEELRKQMLDPYEKRTRDYFKAISAAPSPRAVKPEDLDLKSGQRKDLSNAANTSTQEAAAYGEPASSSHHEPTISDKSPLRPEFVLDGSNVPKEIVFGAPDFKSPQAPEPSPSPKKAGSHQR
jgi:hypothetical protein